MNKEESEFPPKTPKDWIKYGLQNEFPHHAIGDPIEGTYGQVWILSLGDRADIAVKTVMISERKKNTTKDEVTTFERELTLSLMLPHHFNVVPIFGFITDPKLYYLNEKKRAVFVSALKMRAMQGSLEDWVTDPLAATMENRLIAAVQAALGIRHLYLNGFEGHGDIKPSNFLYTDLRELNSEIQKRDSSDSLFPSNQHPYRVVVADLGWADAWVDLGFPQKVLRSYMAPERVKDNVVPEKSDIFSMGILLTELCLCKHPASNFTKSQKSSGNWLRCVENSDWDFAGIKSSRIRKLIYECLSLSPSDRPTINYFIDEICSELEESYGIDSLKECLAIQNDVYSGSQSDHISWASYFTNRISEKESERSLEKLKVSINEINVIDFDTLEDWSTLASSALDIIADDNTSFSIDLRDSARGYLNDILAEINADDLDTSISSKKHPAMFQRFEIFSSQVDSILRILQSSYEDQLKEVNASPLILAAAAFNCAGKFKDSDMKMTRYYLEKCIKHCPNQAVPYYFDVRWDITAEFLKGVSPLHQNFQPYTKKIRLLKLMKATTLAPRWKEPRKIIDQLNG
jgi:serine/threonine protein kinase